MFALDLLSYSLDLFYWGNIPKDKVWIKVGGDKGGGTFKQVFLVGNVARPNDPRNTVVVGRFLLKTTLETSRLP